MKARSRGASSSTRASSTSTPRPIRSIRGAAAWIDRVGICALLPGAELVLPSLWEAVAGTREVEWGVRRADGKLEFTPEMARCWQWKDDLPERGHALVGKHFGRWAAIVAPRLIAEVHAAAAERRESLTSLQRNVVAAVEEHGPCTGPELRELVGAEKKDVDTALVGLQRAVVLTNAQLVEQRQGWGAIAVDLVTRLWDFDAVPADEARRTLAATVLGSAGELSAADLGGALGWRLRVAREALDELVAAGSARVRADEVPLYTPA
jgi:winged helix DNA-binding protein